MTEHEWKKFSGEDIDDVTLSDRLIVLGTMVGTLYLMKKISESAGDQRGWLDWLFGRAKEE